MNSSATWTLEDEAAYIAARKSVVGAWGREIRAFLAWKEREEAYLAQTPRTVGSPANSVARSETEKPPVYPGIRK